MHIRVSKKIKITCTVLLIVALILPNITKANAVRTNASQTNASQISESNTDNAQKINIDQKSLVRFRDGQSRSAIVSDMDTGRIIYQKNAQQRVPMASLSKMMTLLLTFDAIKDKKIRTTDIVTIAQSDVNREGTNILLNAGDKISVYQLMHGMMIVSANDAALALGRYIGGSDSNFALMMNKKAKEIGMKQTYFFNPNGLPVNTNYNGKMVTVENTTTASDCLTLSKWLLKNYPVQLTEITNKDRYVNVAKGINEPNTNPLLPILPSVDGLKTGFTPRAGYCLAYTMPIENGNGNDVKNRLVGISLGTGSKDSRKMISFETLKFIEKHYKTKMLYPIDSSVGQTKINGLGFLRSGLYSDKNIVVMKRNTENFKQEIKYNKINVLKNPNMPAAELLVKDSTNNIIAKADLYPYQNDSKMSFGKRFLIGASTLITYFMNNSVENPKYTIYTL